jgi:oleandomycin transport system ATP-binding protein
VRPADPTRIDDAALILAELAGTPADRPSRGTVSVPMTGDEPLLDAVARIAAAGIAVTELSLHLPSLDEVFFTLTGRAAAAGPEAVLA